MSLGGYKFTGKYCNRGSLTDTQWVLLMHKTKVAAFMGANTLSLTENPRSLDRGMNKYN